MTLRLSLGLFLRHSLLPLTVAAAALASCSSAPDDRAPPADPLAPQPERVLLPFEQQARRGVARERALYPHHFQDETATLTALGKATLATIVEQLPAAGGRIHVAPGSASPQLAAQRLQAVAQRVQELGLPADRVAIAVGQPGGQGAAAVDVLAARAAATEEPLQLGAPITAPSAKRR